MLNVDINDKISKIINADGCSAALRALIEVKDSMMRLVAKRVPGTFQLVEIKSTRKKNKIVNGTPAAAYEPMKTDKLLKSLGEKFGEKPFTEAQFIQHAISVMKDKPKA